MFRIILLSATLAVACGQINVHQVDTLLKSDGLFPGHTVSHTKGNAKQTVRSFSVRLEDSKVINAAYNKYKSNFKKSTPSAEDNARKAEFKKSIQRVMEHNLHASEGKETYGKAINKFSDMDFPEFVRKFTGVKYPNGTSTRKRSAPLSRNLRQSIPDSFDWRDQNMISPVKDQGQCGSCVLFATVGAVEAQYAINNGAGNFPSLSEQQLIDCPPNAGGCNGNSYSNIIPYVQQAGLTSENDDPYQAASGTCPSPLDVVTTISAGNSIASGADSIAQNIANTSPVAVDFRVNQDFKDYDGTSIFNSQDPNCPQAQEGHAILAVGYGTDGSTPYWIMKNSWGTGWGEQGFFKFARGNDICQIEDDPWVVSGASGSGGGGGSGETTQQTTQSSGER